MKFFSEHIAVNTIFSRNINQIDIIFGRAISMTKKITTDVRTYVPTHTSSLDWCLLLITAMKRKDMLEILITKMREPWQYLPILRTLKLVFS